MKFRQNKKIIVICLALRESLKNGSFIVIFRWLIKKTWRDFIDKFKKG